MRNSCYPSPLEFTKTWQVKCCRLYCCFEIWCSLFAAAAPSLLYQKSEHSHDDGGESGERCCVVFFVFLWVCPPPCLRFFFSSLQKCDLLCGNSFRSVGEHFPWQRLTDIWETTSPGDHGCASTAWPPPPLSLAVDLSRWPLAVLQQKYPASQKAFSPQAAIIEELSGTANNVNY